MFIGHFAVALGAKRFAPQVSLGVLFLACQLADIIWPNLVLLGFEKLEVAPGITAMTPLNFVHYPVIAVPFELALFATGAWLYVRHTTPLNRQGSIGLWALIAFLLVIYMANIFGPPPPNSLAVVWSAQAMWIIIAWGFWVDHHRASGTASQEQPA